MWYDKAMKYKIAIISLFLAVFLVFIFGFTNPKTKQKYSETIANCQASDLEGVATFEDSPSGNGNIENNNRLLEGTIALRVRPGVRCLLQKYPSVSLVSAGQEILVNAIFTDTAPHLILDASQTAVIPTEIRSLCRPTENIEANDISNTRFVPTQVAVRLDIDAKNGYLQIPLQYSTGRAIFVNEQCAPSRAPEIQFHPYTQSVSAL